MIMPGECMRDKDEAIDINAEVKLANPRSSMLLTFQGVAAKSSQPIRGQLNQI